MPDAGPSLTPGPGGDPTNFKSQAMKVLIESTPLLNEDNYSMWRKKMEKLFKLRGIFHLMSSAEETNKLDEETNQEMVAYLIAKLDTNKYNNIIDDLNEDNAKSSGSHLVPILHPLNRQTGPGYSTAFFTSR